jgi:hypothetical protein
VLAVSFSLRTLLAVVLLAAIFTAALVYRTPVWVVVVVNLTMIVLIFGTLCAWIDGSQRRFWIPFAFVGWVYLVIAFNGNINELSALLLSAQLGNAALRAKEAPHEAQFIHEARRPNVAFSPDGRVVITTAASVEHKAVTHILHCLAALVFAVLAGEISAFVLRKKAGPTV